MTNATDVIPDIPLDTSKWEEPVRHFFGRITTCRKGTTDEAHGKDGRSFTEVRGLPRAGRTWIVQVQRLDAVYDLLDGTTAPVNVYMTIDLERKGEDGRMVSALKGNNKATFTVNKWTEAGFKLEPDAAVNIDVIAEFDLLPSKMFGSNTAKNILYPTKRLPAGFVYQGEIAHYAVKQDQGTSLDDIASSAESQAQATVKELDDSELAAIVAGTSVAVDAAEIAALLEKHPELSDSAKVKLFGGELQAGLVEKGLLVAGEDGKYAAA